MTPSIFLEAKTGRDFPPAITQAEFYYGFIGATIAWQVLFILLATNPVLYRLLMIPAVLEKASFAAGKMIMTLRLKKQTTGPKW